MLLHSHSAQRWDDRFRSSCRFSVFSLNPLPSSVISPQTAAISTQSATEAWTAQMTLPSAPPSTLTLLKWTPAMMDLVQVEHPSSVSFFNSNFFQLISASQLLPFVSAPLWKRFYLNFMSFTSLEPHYLLSIILQSFLNVTVLHHQSRSGHLFFHPLNGICRIKCIGQIPRNASKQCHRAPRNKCHSYSRK